MNQTIETLWKEVGTRLRVWKKAVGEGWFAGYGRRVADATAADVEVLRRHGVRVERTARWAQAPQAWSLVDCTECGGSFAVVPDGDDIRPVPHAADSPCGLECRGGGAADERAHRHDDCPSCAGRDRAPAVAMTQTCAVCGNAVHFVAPSYPQEKIPPGLAAHVGPCGGLCTGSYAPGAQTKYLHAANCVRCAEIEKLGREPDDE